MHSGMSAQLHGDAAAPWRVARTEEPPDTDECEDEETEARERADAGEDEEMEPPGGLGAEQDGASTFKGSAALPECWPECSKTCAKKDMRKSVSDSMWGAVGVPGLFV